MKPAIDLERRRMRRVALAMLVAPASGEALVLNIEQREE